MSLDAFDAVDELIDAIAAFISHRVAVGEFDELAPTECDWGLEQSFGPCG